MGPHPDWANVRLWDVPAALGERPGQFLAGTGILLAVAVLLYGAFSLALAILFPLVQGTLGGRWANGVTAALLFAYMGLLLLPLRRVLQGMHGRPLRSVLSMDGRFDAALCARSTVLWGGCLAPFLVLGLLEGSVSLSPDWPVAVLVGVAFLPLVLAQVSAEELLVRGYLCQGLQRWLGDPLVTCLASAVLFALLHEGVDWGNPWGQRLVLATMGFFLALVALRANRLEAAIGIHLAQNLYSVFMAGSFGGMLPSLFGSGERYAMSGDPTEVVSGLLVFAVLGGLYWLVGFRLGFLRQ